MNRINSTFNQSFKNLILICFFNLEKLMIKMERNIQENRKNYFNSNSDVSGDYFFY